MTHGCSLFSLTSRRLTALDIVTAHTTLPGREDVALLLEEAMRAEGWTGSKMETRRRLVDERIKRRGNERSVQNDIGKILGVNPGWWGDLDSDAYSDSSSEEEDSSYDMIYVSLAYIDVFPAKYFGRLLQRTTQLCSFFRRHHFHRYLSL
jgi:hypothetical protein